MSTVRSTGSGRSRGETAAIREWANANGLEVSTRGRISSTVLEAYENRATVPAAAPVTEAAAEPAAEVAGEAQPKPKRRTRKKADAAAWFARCRMGPNLAVRAHPHFGLPAPVRWGAPLG